MASATERPCGSRYHTLKPYPPTIAILTRIRGAESLVGEVLERCFDHTVNLLLYWEPFFKIEAVDEVELAEAERKAALFWEAREERATA